MTVGTINNPLSFASVISGQSGALPGSTFLLTPGIYNAPNNTQWLCTLSGTSLAHYTFIGQPGVIIGPITISGAYLEWVDCEFAYTHWVTRYSTIPGSNPLNVFGWARLLIFGLGAVLRRCVIHDLADVVWGIGTAESLFEDCLTYHIGWDADDRAHGHGFYIQNTNAGMKTMRRCVSLMNYATPAKIYSATTAPLENITIEDSVFAIAKEGYTYVQSDMGIARNITIRNLLTYGIQWKHSCAAINGGPLSVDGGVIVPSLDIDWYAFEGFKNWQSGASIRNLLIIARRAVSTWPNAATDGWIDESEYHVIPPSIENAPFTTYADRFYTSFAAWQLATGNDTNSTYSTELPVEPRIDVIVRRNDSVVVVYNWNADASVVAPISGMYRNGFNLRETLALNASDMLPMNTWSTATPIGANEPMIPWDIKFGVFIVTPISV